MCGESSHKEGDAPAPIAGATHTGHSARAHCEAGRTNFLSRAEPHAPFHGTAPCGKEKAASGIESVLDLARIGDASARDELILFGIDFVPQIVGAFVRQHYDAAEIVDDLEGAGHVALVEAVDSAIASTEVIDNLAAHLKRSIRNGIRCYEEEWSGTSESKDTVRRQRKRCDKISARLSAIEQDLAATDLDQQAALHDERDQLSLQLVKAQPLARRALGPDDNEIAGPNPFAASELREVIDACCTDDEERQVIELRSRDMTDEEVAAELNLSRLSVLRIRKAVEARFNTKMAAMERDVPRLPILSRKVTSQAQVPSSLAIGA